MVYKFKKWSCSSEDEIITYVGYIRIKQNETGYFNLFSLVSSLSIK